MGKLLPPKRQGPTVSGKLLPFFLFFPKDLPHCPDFISVRGKKLPHFLKSGSS